MSRIIESSILSRRLINRKLLLSGFWDGKEGLIYMRKTASKSFHHPVKSVINAKMSIHWLSISNIFGNTPVQDNIASTHIFTHDERVSEREAGWLAETHPILFATKVLPCADTIVCKNDTSNGM